MRLLVKLVFGVALALLFSAAFCGAADAHMRGRFGGGVIIAPYPYYSPYYDPWYYPQPYYPPPNYGWLKTDVEPNTAEVWVDGKFFGYVKDFDGPINHLKLPLGLHEVDFKAPGYKTFSVNVDISPDATSEVEYNLRPLPSGTPPDRHDEGSDSPESDEEY